MSLVQSAQNTATGFIAWILPILHVVPSVRHHTVLAFRLFYVEILSEQGILFYAGLIVEIVKQLRTRLLIGQEL